MASRRLASGKNTVMLPADINLAVPTSEKQFVGDIPFGSYFDMDLNNYVGVYWRGEWGTDDYDLSYINEKGMKYGWNTRYKDDSGEVVYSGDMTQAEPEATEMFYCSRQLPDGFFKLNRYDGEPGSRARIFFGHEEIADFHLSYMVDPKTIVFKADIFPEQNDCVIGGVFDNRIYIFSVESGNARVSSDSTALMCLSRRIRLQLQMRDLLTASGYEVLDPDSDAVPDYDFRNYTKSQLIEFYSSIEK